MSQLRDILSRAEITTLHVAAARTKFKKVSERLAAERDGRVLKGREKRLRWLNKREAGLVVSFDRRVGEARQRYASQVGHTRDGRLIMPIPTFPARRPDLDLRGKVAA